MTLEAKQLSTILALSSITCACGLQEKAKELKIPFVKTEGIKKTITKQKKVSITCKKGSLKDYTNKGWKVISSKESDIICTWKSVKSKPGCRLDKDKGCKITVPDKKGKQIEYLLEKEFKTNKK